MADERFPALKAYLDKLPNAEVSGITGKAAAIRLHGDGTVRRCVVMGYDDIGIHVKVTNMPGTGGPDTQFYLWHNIQSIQDM